MPKKCRKSMNKSQKMHPESIPKSMMFLTRCSMHFGYENKLKSMRKAIKNVSNFRTKFGTHVGNNFERKNEAKQHPEINKKSWFV